MTIRFVAASTLVSVLAVTPLALQQDELPSGAEFPPQDLQILSLVRKGAAAKLANRWLKESPETPDTIRLLVTNARVEELLGALPLLVRNHPERIAETFEALLSNMHRFQQDLDSRGLKPRLQAIVADARKRSAELSTEASARAERILLEFDGYFSPAPNRDARTIALTNFVETHAGTEAALLTEVDLLTAGRISIAQLDSLAAFARAHPRTVAAAKATYLRGFHLAVNFSVTRIEQPGSDPTERFMQVVEISRDLESGTYPPCEWVDKAPSIVWQFYASQPVYSPENLQRMLATSYEFTKSHFRLAESAAESEIGYFVTSKISALMKAQGDEIGGMETVFTRLERDVSDVSAVRYLRAQYFLRRMRESSSERVPMLQKALAALNELQAQGSDLYHRKALATLGALRFGDGDYVNARSDLLKYARQYPKSDWAWIATLRAALCDHERGNFASAANTSLAVTKDRSNPVARVLAYAYAGRAYEGQGRFDLANREYQQSIDAWDKDYGQTYSLFLRRPSRASDPFGAGDWTVVSNDGLRRRTAQLKASLALPGGERLERARWLLDAERRDEALSTLQPLLKDRSTTAVHAQARYLMHKAQFELALDKADADRNADDAAAMKTFDALAAEPLDFVVTAARIAKASLLRETAAADAQTTMRQALEAWHAQQRFVKPASGLEQDVADIRNLVFQPNGAGVFASSHWNGFDWSRAAAPFAIVNPDVRVKLADGDVVTVSVQQPLSVGSKVLFVDSEQMGLLRATLVRLGGNRKRVPTGVMETPNQPVGASMQILDLWRNFFFAQPGHWGGWVLETYPIITEILFVDASRTRAEVAVTVGYSGCTVILEKEGGVWTAKRLTNRWIT